MRISKPKYLGKYIFAYAKRLLSIAKALKRNILIGALKFQMSSVEGQASRAEQTAQEG